MARGLIRKPSFNKIVGAYRSQWKRFWMRLFTFGMYGRKGMGWWRDPKKAWYNWWYRRSSISVYQILGCKPSRGACFFAMLCAGVIGVFAAPVDATRAGVKAHKIKKTRKARATSGGTNTSQTRNTGTGSARTTGNTVKTSASRNSGESSQNGYKTTPASKTSAARSTTRQNEASTHTTSSRSASTQKTAPKKTTSTTVKTNPIHTSTVEEESLKTTATFTPTIYHYEPPKPITPPDPVVTEPDENTPKSKPKNDGDQYIRKRMIIAGSHYCDESVLSELKVGTYFDLEAEPDNPYDKDAVMLLYNSQKIGYVAKADRLPFVTCLKLHRKIYGVITKIDTESTPIKYEFETWFEQHK